MYYEITETHLPINDFIQINVFNSLNLQKYRIYNIEYIIMNKQFGRSL